MRELEEAELADQLVLEMLEVREHPPA